MIDAAGPPYTSKLNVELPIARRFEALGYTVVFREAVAAVRRKCRDTFRSVAGTLRGVKKGEKAARACAAVEATWESLRVWLDSLGYDPPTAELYDSIVRAATDAHQAPHHVSDELERSREDEPGATPPDGQRPARRQSEGEEYSLRSYRSALEELEEALVESSGELAVRPALLITGDAGSGKTHLLCDVASRRIGSGLPSIVVLGQQLDRGEVWNQIINRLGLQCSRDEFLGALDSAAEAAGSRALIFIDAINEASGIPWQDELPTVFTILARYPRVGLVVSCRSTYESQLVRQDLLSGRRLARVEHEGFAPRLFEALTAYCRFYGIETLNTPPLNPEFQNPLFLKLFCEGLRNRGLSRPPKGHTGFERIFSFLIESVNEKLHQPKELDYPTDRGFLHSFTPKQIGRTARRSGRRWRLGRPAAAGARAADPRRRLGCRARQRRSWPPAWRSTPATT